MKIKSRLLCATALLLVIYGATWLGATGGRPGKIGLPSKDLGALPAGLGRWLGEESEVDAKLFSKTGSEACLTRVYRNAAGQEIATYIAVFADYLPSRGLILPHSAELCYPANGYRIVDEQDVRISSEKGLQCTARMLTVERDRSTLFVLFWYQAGDRFFTTNEAMRTTLWSFRGQDVWPPIVKVLLQASAPDARSAREALRDLATPLLTWFEDYR